MQVDDGGEPEAAAPFYDGRHELLEPAFAKTHPARSGAGTMT